MKRSPKHWILLIPVATILPLLIVFVVLLCIPVVNITESVCRQIEPGMTVTEAAAIIGGEPRGYDGIGGWRDDIRPYRKDDPTWIALSGAIVLYVDDDGKVIKANYAKGSILSLSVPEFVWERLTRNVYGPEPRYLVSTFFWGVVHGVLVGGSFAMAAVFLSRHLGQQWIFYACVLGVILSAVFLLLVSIAVAQGSRTEPAFATLGASASALICCIVASVFTDRRRPLEKHGFVAKKCA